MHSAKGRLFLMGRRAALLAYFNRYNAQGEKGKNANGLRAEA